MIQRKQLNIETLPDVIDLYLTDDVYDRCGSFCDTGGCAIGTLLQEAGLPVAGRANNYGGFMVAVNVVTMLANGGMPVDLFAIERVGESAEFGCDHFNARWTGIIRLTRIEEQTK